MGIYLYCFKLYGGAQQQVGIQSKLLTGTIIVIHLEKEAFVVKSTGNIKENLEKLSECDEVVPLDGNQVFS